MDALRVSERGNERESGTPACSSSLLRRAVLAATLMLIAVGFAGCTSASLSNGTVGTPARHQLSVSPSSLDFPDTQVGLEATMDVVLTNIGVEPVTFTSIVISGSGAADYVPPPLGECQSFPGPTCALPVRFAPHGPGPSSATLTIVSNAASSPQTVKLTGNGVTPPKVLTITPASLTFPPTPVGGRSPQQAVTIANTGTNTVTVAEFDTNGDFFLDPTSLCPAGMAPGTSCQIRLAFTPQSSGLRSGTLTISSDGFGSPQTVTLSGNGIPGTKILSITPNPLKFPDTVVGGTSDLQTITVTNVGTGRVVMSGSSLSGPNTTDFSASALTCKRFSLLLDPGNSCSIDIRFVPTDLGQRMATVTILSDASNSPQSVTLQGNGVAPTKTITLAPNPVSFSPTVVGVTTANQRLSVTNTGNTLVTIHALLPLSGTNPADFSVDKSFQGNNCLGFGGGSFLAPGNVCTIDFTFTPTALGARMATFSLSDDAVGSPQMVTLMGNGVAPTKILTITPDPLKFPDTPVGPFSESGGVLSFKNTGNTPVKISGISLSGPNATDFSVLPTIFCLGGINVVAPGEICLSPSILFRPGGLGLRTATLTITSDATGSPQTVTLQGNGIVATKVLTIPDKEQFPDTVVGQSSLKDISVTNTGNSPVHITLPSVSGPNAGDFFPLLLCPNSLPPGVTCGVNVQFVPRALGLRTATLTVTSDATTSPQTVTLTGNGVQGVLTIAPSSLIFPDTPVGSTSPPQTVTVANNSSTPVQISVIATAGTNPGDFVGVRQLNACGRFTGTVSPGNSCVVTFTFNPTAIGPRSAAVTITSNGVGSPQTVTLSGNGVPPLTLAPNPLSFAPTPVGRLSTPQTLTVTNTGPALVRFNGFTIGGANAVDFQIATNRCITPTSGAISPNASCTIDFTFNPQAAGARTATLTIASDGAGSPQMVTLNGNGLPGGLSLTPNPLNFPDTPVGRLSASQTLTITNTGPATVRFNAISLSGVNASDFQIATNRCQTPTSGALSANASCTIDFTFNPQAAGARTATLTIASDGAGSPQMVTLNGNGIAGQLSLTPNPLNFHPDTVVGTTSAAQTLTITNTGPATVRFTAISLGGANAADFHIATDRCITPTSGALSANVSCTIDFTFNPQAAGARTATLTVASDGAGSPQQVTLTGNGIASTKILTLTPNPLNFPDTVVGSTSASQVITVTSTGTSPVNISSVTLAGGNPGDFAITNTTCAVPPAVLSGSCTVSLAFAPTAAGPRSASFTVMSDATGSPQTVTLTGNGIAPAATTPRFAYEANPDGTVSIFTVNPATGRLQSRGYATVPLTGTASAPALALDPQKRFVFYGIANSVLPSSSVFTFTVDSSTGALTLQPGSATTSGNVLAVAVDPSGRFLYVGGGSASAGHISAFSINSTTGALTQIIGSPFTTSGISPRIAIDPSGKFLYAGDSFGVSAFTIDQTTGALTPVAGSPFAAGAFAPDAITVDPKGKFAYFLSNGSIFAFAINGTSGVLTPVPGSPFAPSAPNLVTVSLAIDPTGAFMYVTNNSQVQGTSSISAYKLDAITGALTPITGSPFSAGTAEPFWVSVDPSGAFLYVPSFDTNLGGIIETFSIAPGTGVLTALGTTPARLFPHAPVQLTISTGTAPVTSKPQYVLIANSGSNDVSAYNINPGSGTLTAISGSPFLAGTSPVSVSTDLLGRFAYVANSGSNDISAFGISPTTGTLAPVTGSPFTTGGTGPQSVVVDLSSEFVYAGNSVSQNISEFALNPSTGALAAISGSPLGASFTLTALSGNPTGQQIFAVGTGIGNFTMGNFYDVTVNGNPSSANPNGVLSLANTLSVGTELKSSSVAVHPSGRFVYVTNMGSNHVTGLSLTCCQTVPVPGSPFPTGTNPAGVAIEPLGRFLYVANSGSNNVSAYSIDPATGTASPLTGSPFPAGTNPSALSADGSGKFLLVTNKGDNTVSVFTIDSSTGMLTAVAGSPFVTGTAPAAITAINKVQ